MTKPETLAQLRKLHEELVAINNEIAYDDAVDPQTDNAFGKLVAHISVLRNTYENFGVHSADSPGHLALVDRVRQF
jgi:hypothetical protein